MADTLRDLTERVAQMTREVESQKTVSQDVQTALAALEQRVEQLARTVQSTKEQGMSY
jgi:DNA-binding transcriptional regulator GbsR (MarR family)